MDRLPLHAVIPLLAQSRRALAPGAPLVVVSSRHPPNHRTGRAHGSLRPGRRSLCCTSQTWGLLLERSGFADIGGLGGQVDSDPTGASASRPRRRPCEWLLPLRPGPAPGRRHRPSHPAPARRHPGPGLSSNIFVDVVADDTAVDTLPVLAYSGRGRTGRRRRVPVRHGVPDGPVARRPHRDAGRELPQRHPTRSHGALGSSPGTRPGAGPGRSGGPGAE